MTNKQPILEVHPDWKSVTKMYRTDTHKVVKTTIWRDGNVIKNRTKFTRLSVSGE